MPKIDVQLETPVQRTFRVDQVAGLFDCDVAEKSRLELSVHVPPHDDASGGWRIGVIVGPSGSGKTSVARQAYGERFIEQTAWPADAAIVDGFPEDVPGGMEAITGALNAVGFSSPPQWVLPYGVLSTGQRMRRSARALLTKGPVVAFDEFTSVVDRQVGRFASAAVSKAVRKRRVPAERFVAVTCHYDVIDWLEPDWVLDMTDRRLTVLPDMPLHNTELAQLPRGQLQRRPPEEAWRRPTIQLRLRRVSARSTWPVFGRHHYLSAKLHPACAVTRRSMKARRWRFWRRCPMPGTKAGASLHRLVVLPDFQGMGVGLRVLDAVARIEHAQLATRRPKASRA